LLSDVPLEELHSAPETVIPFVERCSKISIDDKTINLPPEVVDIIEQENDRQSAPTDDLAPTPTLQGVKVVGKIDLSKYERPKKEIKPGKQNYYIIDTNVFVNCPDILDKIDKEYPIILSAKVTDELDKMKIKLDEKSKQNAEKALRLLNRENTHKIIYEFADVSLLPDDFNKKSPDNMILSVALKYKDDNPIMLTSDNGLQLKSKIFGITTISLKDFLRKR
jgi:rRNA-processing protein FCF1